MRISDWSSDVCSSDLLAAEHDLTDLGLVRFANLAQPGIGDGERLGFQLADGFQAYYRDLGDADFLRRQKQRLTDDHLVAVIGDDRLLDAEALNDTSEVTALIARVEADAVQHPQS